MYGIRLIVNQLVRTNLSNQMVRYKRNTAKKLVDPGIQNRKSLLYDEKELEQLNDYEFDLEADFMKVPATHEEYQREQEFLKERKKYMIVRQKYFKEVLPNFLTWSDKQQMRHLYNTNPEEWTIEKLSEGFPVLPTVVAKIVNSSWTKSNKNKIQNHDESVKKNWALFKEGKLADLPPALAEHLQKFTDRDLNFKPFEVPEKFKVDNTKSMIAPNLKVGTEFAEIIQSYKRLKNKDVDSNESANNYSILKKPPEDDTYVIGDKTKFPRRNIKDITLDCLQEKIQKKVQEGRASADDKIMLQVLRDKAVNEKETKDLKVVEVNKAINMKYTTNNEIVTVKQSNNHLNIYDYPNKIVIPKDKFKPGYTYKLNDCYYDDDGEFLYRVPVEGKCTQEAADIYFTYEKYKNSFHN